MTTPPNYEYATDFGQPSETSIVPPTITTQASSEGDLGVTKLTDTLQVSGVVTTDEGFSVVDRLYQLPSVLSPSGEPQLAPSPSSSVPTTSTTPSTSAASSSSGSPTVTPTCTAANLVGTAAPIPVTTDGSYTTTPLNATTSGVTAAGVYGWQETLLDAAGNVVSVGECAPATEQTVVRQLSASTTVTHNTQTIGTPIVDTATITGTLLPGMTDTFTLYQQTGSTPSVSDPVAGTTPAVPLYQAPAASSTTGSGTSTTPTGTSTSTTTTTSGASSPVPDVVTNLVVTAPSLTTMTPGTYYFVETITDTKGDVLAQDTRGEPSETVQITPASGSKSAGSANMGARISTGGNKPHTQAVASPSTAGVNPWTMTGTLALAFGLGAITMTALELRRTRHTAKHRHHPPPPPTGVRDPNPPHPPSPNQP